MELYLHILTGQNQGSEDGGGFWRPFIETSKEALITEVESYFDLIEADLENGWGGGDEAEIGALIPVIRALRGTYQGRGLFTNINGAFVLDTPQVRWEYQIHRPGEYTEHWAGRNK